MGEPYVREVGQVADIYGQPVVIGIDHDAVSVGGHVIGPRQLDQLAQLIVRATWDAARQVSTMTAALACPADCGGETHDETCTPLPEGTVNA